MPVEPLVEVLLPLPEEELPDPLIDGPPINGPPCSPIPPVMVDPLLEPGSPLLVELIPPPAVGLGLVHFNSGQQRVQPFGSGVGINVQFVGIVSEIVGQVTVLQSIQVGVSPPEVVV